MVLHSVIEGSCLKNAPILVIGADVLVGQLSHYGALRTWRGKLHYVKDILTHVLPSQRSDITRKSDSSSLGNCDSTTETA